MAEYTAQPPNVVFTSAPAPVGIIPGLEPLLNASHFIVKQKKEMVEIFSGFERNNRYEVYNEHGQLAYYAAEDSTECSLCCLGAARPFKIRVFDGFKRQAIVIRAEINCCTQRVYIEVPEGQFFATIDREFAWMTPSFLIRDTAGAVMFKIKSPLTAAFGSFGNVKFDVLSADQQTVIGQISKQWGGLAKEMFTGADTFGVSLPADMDVMWKAVLLAACFHIDFSFYQQR